MRTATATALALATAISAPACKSQQASDASSIMSFDWSQRSADAKIEIRQRRESKGDTSTCRVQALDVASGKVLWSGTNCIPAPSGLVFMSKNGERLLVLDLFPSAAIQSPDWSRVSLAQIWNKGVVERGYKGAEILAADRAADMRKSFSWLRGETYEEVRESAHAVADGTQVSIDLADGRTITLGFDGAALPTPPSVSPVARPPEVAVAAEPKNDVLPARDEPPPTVKPAQPVGLADGELYRWQDDSGAVHFSTGAEVPPKYQKRAQPVQGRVGIVPMDSPAEVPQPAQPGRSGQPSQAGQPARASQPGPAAAAAQPAEQPAATTSGE